MSEDHKKTLQTQLWNIANTLRGKMGADEFRDYILGFIFYKYLSERMHLFADKILKNDGIQFDAIDESSKKGKEMLAAIQEESVDRLGYFLKPSELFHKVAEKGARKEDNFILGDLAEILKHIEASTMGHGSEDDFEGLFEDLDLGSSKLGKTENQKNELVVKVLAHLDKIDFRLHDTEADVLGDAYEYLIGQFASGAGKKAGEFYTPQEVSTILAKIVTTGKKSLKSVYDPTCGSGSLLLRVAKEVKSVDMFYGQEMNPTTYNLARMNMILHGVHYQRFDLKNEDTLEHPAPEHADLRFEAIVANPPFSANWSASAIHEQDDRFSAYGKLAPKTKADFAFVQHMVHHLDSGATMACVLPHGVLFRGAAEGHIRKYLIEDCNYLDAVIGLPANIFFGTSIPTCVLVLKKQRENPDDILFIDASEHFEKVGNQNQLRQEDVDRIVDAYRKRKSIRKFCKVAELSEVQGNDYNLNIPRYVDTFNAEQAVDLDAVVANLAVVEETIADADKVIRKNCSELGLLFPKGHNRSLLEAYKKGVMQQLFSRILRFQNDQGNDFPDWEEKVLGEISRNVMYGMNAAAAEYDGRTKYIRITDIDENSNKFKPNPITSPDQPAEDRYILRRGDIVFARTGASVGKSYLFDEADGNLAFAGFLIRFSIREREANAYFVFLQTQTDEYWKWVKVNSMRSGQPGINAEEYRTLPLLLPSLPEQTKIANFIAALDRKIECVAAQMDSAQIWDKKPLRKVFV